MKIRNLIPAAAGTVFLFLLSSCGKVSVDAVDGMPSAARINIRTSIDALTKSPQLDENGKGNFSDGDILTVTISGEGFKEMDKEYVTGSTELWWADLNLPEETEDVYFSACYPAQEAIQDGKFTFTVSPEGETDLLLAGAVRAEKYSESAVSLTFRHALHKLIVKYVSDGSVDDETLSAITTSVKALSSCTIDRVKGELEAGSASGMATVGNRQGDQVSFLIIPQEKDNVTLEVAMGEITRTFTIPDRAQDGSPVNMLEGGKVLTVLLSVSSGGIRIDGAQIEGWEQQGTITGEIPL